MKKKLPVAAVIMFLILFLTAAGELFSQTPGTFSFSVTTNASGSYGARNLLAIWIENNQPGAAFVKTKIRYSSGDNLDHLNTWVTKSGQNVVDAVTGSTRTSHGVVSFLWNGTNVSGTVVPDGSYFVWLEMAWDDNLTNGKAVNSFPFTKGSSLFHSTPAGNVNFLSLVLDWTPLSTGIEGRLESKDLNVYPNPSSGLLKIEFKQPEKECLVQIINETGKTEYYEKLSDIQAGVRTLDLTRLQGGSYYCILRFPEKDVVFNIILVK